ncbi:MAG: beta-N-acetylglucosaminidase domain-containing protein [Actinobacteria bacterium]|nr:beta-N-acetylglucosaminidase domain-containing protein [Actinomycetota bacterium]
MASGFEVRGVIEGFYGPPWSFPSRVRAVEFLAPRGMNAYVYAPKDDPFHRARWRDPYPDDELAGLVDFAGHCAEMGVRFGYAISPGLDIDPGNDADRAALWDKLAPLVDGGVDWIVLAFDDVPLRDGAGAGQADLVGWVRERAGGVRLSLVPTDYVGSVANAYLDELTAGLAEDVDLFWTGSTVVPAEITSAEAAARREVTGGRPLLIWDNYPVNDAFMAGSLHLGPLRGRDPGLAGVCAGLLANPMTQAGASLLPLATAMEYLADPEGYDPEAAWERAIADLGGSSVPALRGLARACATSRLSTRAPLHGLVDAVVAGEPEAAKALREELEGAASLPAGLADGLVDEVGPWARQAAAEASLGLTALRVLEDSPGSGDPWSSALSVMGMLIQWQGVRASGSQVVFGPRFACYPGIVVDSAGSVRVDAGLSLVEDQNAVDRLCRLALAGAGPDGPVRAGTRP